jgi:hypothetical protein
MISDERKAQMRSRIEYLKARQRCVACARQDAYTLVGRALCGDCCERRREAKTRWREQNWERDNARMMDRYQRLKAGGLCVSCGRERDRAGAYCRRCADKKAERSRNRYAAEQASLVYGQCRWCRKPAVPGKAYCQACLEQMSETRKAWWREKKAAEGTDPVRKEHPWRR